MRKLIGATILACAFASAVSASSQVKMTKEQMMFYTSDWKGERFPDGRPKIPDDLLKRALDVSIEPLPLSTFPPLRRPRPHSAVHAAAP